MGVVARSQQREAHTAAQCVMVQRRSRVIAGLSTCTVTCTLALSTLQAPAAQAAACKGQLAMMRARWPMLPARREIGRAGATQGLWQDWRGGAGTMRRGATR